MNAREYGQLVTTGQPATPAPSVTDSVRALLVSAGVDPAHIRDVKRTSGAWLRPGDGTQYTVSMDRAGRLTGTNIRSLSDDIIANGRIVIIRLKEVA